MASSIAKEGIGSSLFNIYIGLIIVMELLIIIEIPIAHYLYKYARNRWDNEKQSSFPKYRKRLYIFSILILLTASFYPLFLFPYHIYVFLGLTIGSIYAHIFGFAIALRTLLPSDNR